MNSDDVSGVFCLLLFAGAIYGVYRYRKARPRYITDEHGERQRVTAWKQGQPIYTPTSWQQRAHGEVTKRRERRQLLFGLLLFIAPLVGGAVWLGERNEFLGKMALFIVGLAVLKVAMHWLPALVMEIRYLLGDQSMEGAKVRDKRPKPAQGAELVETQKAHGDARVAGETEALTLLSSRN